MAAIKSKKMEAFQIRHTKKISAQAKHPGVQ
jgi:hypothetical protein